MMKFDVGDQVRIAADFTNLAGIAADPTSVTLTVRSPNQTVTTVSGVVNSAVGSYYGDVTLDQVGEWNYRWVGTGALVVAEEGSFYVRVRKV